MTVVATSLLLALGQLADARVLRVLGKSLAVSIAICLVLGWALWFALDWALLQAGLADGLFAGSSALRAAAAGLAALLGLWLLWRIVALAVVQYFADDVVQAVEARHYPEAAGQARDLPVWEQLRTSLASGMRALLVNLAALPLALLLLPTVIGVPLLFFAVNAILLGRELQDMVWLRHRHRAGEAAPFGRMTRVVLGGATAALLLVPFANLLAPVIGAAAATHLFHRGRGA